MNLRKRIQEIATEQDVAEVESIENENFNDSVEMVKDVKDASQILNTQEETIDAQDEVLEVKDNVEELIEKPEEEIKPEEVAAVERLAFQALAIANIKMSDICLESNYDYLSKKEKLGIVLQKLNDANTNLELVKESLWTDFKDKLGNVGKFLTGNFKSLDKAIENLKAKLNNQFDKDTLEKIINKRMDIFNNEVDTNCSMLMVNPTGKLSTVFKDICDKIELVDVLIKEISGPFQQLEKDIKKRDNWTSKGYWMLITAVLINVAETHYNQNDRVYGNTMNNRILDKAERAYFAENKKNFESAVEHLSKEELDKIENMAKNLKTYFKNPVKAPKADLEIDLNACGQYIDKIKTLNNKLKDPFNKFFSIWPRVIAGLQEGNGRRSEDSTAAEFIIFNISSLISGYNELVYQTQMMLKEIEENI